LKIIGEKELEKILSTSRVG